MQAKYFHEVSYRDDAGKSHTHLVHNTQLPLPPTMARGLTEGQMANLNNQDYWVCLDSERIAAELEANLLKAERLAEDGYNPSFSTRGRLSRHGATVIAEGLFGKTLVRLGWLNDAGLATSIGFRPEMEDAHVDGSFSTDFGDVHYSAIFDGHGGVGCAKFAEAHLISHLIKWLGDESLLYQTKDVRIFNALNLAFTDLNRSFLEEVAGSTAVLALQIEDELWLANLGDSRALYVTEEKTYQLTTDQKPRDNRALIEGRGGIITYDNRIMHNESLYTIAPGRSFGDHHLKGGMSPRPVISRLKLTKPREDGYLVVACDGVFDVASSNQVGELVVLCHRKELEPPQIAGAVAIRAIKAGSGDNISVLVKKV